MSHTKEIFYFQIYINLGICSHLQTCGNIWNVICQVFSTDPTLKTLCMGHTRSFSPESSKNLILTGFTGVLIIKFQRECLLINQYSVLELEIQRDMGKRIKTTLNINKALKSLKNDFSFKWMSEAQPTLYFCSWHPFYYLFNVFSFLDNLFLIKGFWLIRKINVDIKLLDELYVIKNISHMKLGYR